MEPGRGESGHGAERAREGGRWEGGVWAREATSGFVLHAERIDEEAAARMAVEHLIDLGHTRIALIGAGLGAVGAAGAGLDAAGARGAGSDGAARVRGCLAVLRAAGLAPAAVLDGENSVAGGKAAMSALLTRCRPDLPTAVFCQSDEMAFGGLTALRRAGLRCPDDMSVVGVDDHELAEAFDLTTVGAPVRAQGLAAALWLAAALRRYSPPNSDPDVPQEEPEDVRVPGAEVTDVLHPVRLVRRGSTAAVPAIGSGTR